MCVALLVLLLSVSPLLLLAFVLFCLLVCLCALALFLFAFGSFFLTVVLPFVLLWSVNLSVFVRIGRTGALKRLDGSKDYILYGMCDNTQ